MKKLAILAVAALSMGLFGCAGKTAVPLSSVLVPSVMGTAEVSKDSNNNAKIELVVHHLAAPQKLTPPRTVYVVWVETSNNDKFNIGQLVVDKNLDGNLVSTTPYDSFRLVVTAEDSATVMKPSEQMIFTTEQLSAK